LDIGCGIRPQNFFRPQVHICCEPFDQYIDRLREDLRSRQESLYVIIKATWDEAVRLFPERSVDTVFLVDVIEHLEKEQARELLQATEKIARVQVAVFTPLGFLPQHHPDGIDAWGLNGGAWQEHKSGWQPEDFDSTWDIYAAKIFHTKDHTGRPFTTPYGAMWAIKTIDNGFTQSRLYLNVMQAIAICRRSLQKAKDRVISLLFRLYGLFRRL
jgi:hypothetical protein